MAEQPAGRHLPGRSFTARFALLLLLVGLAAAVVVGVLAWVQTQGAQQQRQLQAGQGGARLAQTLVASQTTAVSQRFACEVAALPATRAAYQGGGSQLAGLARAAVEDAQRGQALLLLGQGGQVRAESGAPGSGGPGPLLHLPVTPGDCAGTTSSRGYFALGAGHRVLGLGVARVAAAGGTLGYVEVQTPLAETTLGYVRRLLRTSGLGGSLGLVLGGRLALPAELGGTDFAAGARLPPALLAASRGRGGVGQAQLGGRTRVVAMRSLPGPRGEEVAALLFLGPGPAPGVTVAGLAWPLALAVAGVLLLGLVLVFLLVERNLNRPLRRLDLAVQRLGADAYAEPVQVGPGAEEITRLAANVELVRRQLRRQLLMATGRTVIASTLTGSAPVEQALSQVLRSLADLLDADLGLILLRPQAQSPKGLVLSAPELAWELSWAEVESGFGLLGGLVRDPRFVVRSHLAQEERHQVEERLRLRDCLVEPLRSGDKDLGLLLVGNKRQPYQDEDYTLCRSVADQVVVAVEKSARLELTLREATTDEMTGLYNYRFLVGYLDQQVNVADRARSPLSVLMLDLDHFKEVNDTHGHPAGDRLLRHFAALLVETIRKSDLAARYGGEEFVVVMANTQHDDAALVAEKIRQAVERMRVGLEDETTLQVTVSVGGVTFPDGSKGARNLLDLADRALYSAKRNGRNRVQFLDSGQPQSEALGG